MPVLEHPVTLSKNLIQTALAKIEERDPLFFGDLPVCEDAARDVYVEAMAMLRDSPEFRRAVWSVCSFEWFLHPKGRTNYRTVTGSIIERPAMIFAANDVAAAVTDWPVTGSEESPDGYEQLSW
jgi:hypothetical protein